MELDVACKDGFLIDRTEWDRGLAVLIARDEGIELTDAHWELIRFTQNYYEEYHITPIMRILAKAIRKRLGEDKGTSKYLYSLFPEAPVRQLARIAGLPKPPSCI